MSMNCSRKAGMCFSVTIALATFSLPGIAANNKIAAGKVLYDKTCASCHSTAEGVNQIGPTLYKVVGRHAAAVPNYSYSSIIRAADLVWNEETLVKFLSGPQAMIPCHQIATKSLVSCLGTKMTFSGLQSEANAKAVVAYLKSQ